MERVGKTLANFKGEFLEYDKNNNSSFWKQYMRLRVKIDVRKQLKQNTREKNKGGEWCMVNFKYEKLSMFCFVCGILGHSEQRCEVRFAMAEDDGSRGWSNDIRVDNMRINGGSQISKWLKEENSHGGAAAEKCVEYPSVTQAREFHTIAGEGGFHQGRERAESSIINALNFVHQEALLQND